MRQVIDFYENPKTFIKLCKKACKENFLNFIEDKNEDLKLFQNIKGNYNGVPCLMPSGEDEFFMQKILKKYQNPIDNCSYQG